MYRRVVKQRSPGGGPCPQPRRVQFAEDEKSVQKEKKEQVTAATLPIQDPSTTDTEPAVKNQFAVDPDFTVPKTKGPRWVDAPHALFQPIMGLSYDDKRGTRDGSDHIGFIERWSQLRYDREHAIVATGWGAFRTSFTELKRPVTGRHDIFVTVAGPRGLPDFAWLAFVETVPAPATRPTTRQTTYADAFPKLLPPMYETRVAPTTRPAPADGASTRPNGASVPTPAARPVE